MTTNTEIKTEQENSKLQLSDTPRQPRIDYLRLRNQRYNIPDYTPISWEISRIPLGQPDQVITCTCSYVGDNIEDVCFMNNIYKKDEIKELIKQKE